MSKKLSTELIVIHQVKNHRIGSSWTKNTKCQTNKKQNRIRKYNNEERGKFCQRGVYPVKVRKIESNKIRKKNKAKSITEVAFAMQVPFETEGLSSSGDCPLFAPDPGPDPDRGLDPCDMPVLCE
ncbi:hypothetical protein RUM44_003220 [Polyplax serrata]|uniref:Uncharacterized protein n=1 Tax=Polyplax serrata TaxID=468196 RepID=A0ABR1AXW0_POLSC